MEELREGEVYKFIRRDYPEDSINDNYFIGILIDKNRNRFGKYIYTRNRFYQNDYYDFNGKETPINIVLPSQREQEHLNQCILNKIYVDKPEEFSLEMLEIY